MPSRAWRGIADTAFRRWMIAFASALMNSEVEFWYDQFLAKPPRDGAPTCWHQDEAYWGRNLLDRGITCWMPLHDVDERNGCMHFIDRGHRELPVEASFTGRAVQTGDSEIIEGRLQEIDNEERVVLVDRVP